MRTISDSCDRFCIFLFEKMSDVARESSFRGSRSSALEVFEKDGEGIGGFNQFVICVVTELFNRETPAVIRLRQSINPHPSDEKTSRDDNAAAQNLARQKSSGDSRKL